MKITLHSMMRLFLSLTMLLSPLSVNLRAQNVPADAAITAITMGVKILPANARELGVKWGVTTKGNAVPVDFTVRAEMKIVGGGTITRTNTVGGTFRSTQFILQASEVAQKTGKGKNTASGVPPLNPDGSSPIVPKPKPGATPTPAPSGLPFVIESAIVTVTGKFKGGEAANVSREFIPPALAPSGELRLKSGGNNGDVQIAKVIDLEKSPRASQCAAGRDCFEVQTAAAPGAGDGKGISVNLEVLYADGTRKSDTRAIPAPGRPLVFTIDNPANTAFTSVRATVRGNADGTFTRTAKKEDLLSF